LPAVTFPRLEILAPALQWMQLAPALIEGQKPRMNAPGEARMNRRTIRISI
jgi:hypothetical protein